MSSTADQYRFFSVAIESNELYSQVRVNDIPVVALPKGRVVTELPVSPNVFTGNNTLDLIVRPAEGSDALSSRSSCEVTLYGKAHQEAQDGEALARIEFAALGGFDASPGMQTDPPSLTVQELPNGGGFWSRQLAILATPFAPWVWLNAPQLQVDAELHKALYTQLEGIWQLLSARDVAGLNQVCMQQAREYQQAYELPTEQDGVHALGYQAMVVDPQVNVEPLAPAEELRVELLADGRMAHLVDIDNKSPLKLSVNNIPNMQGRFGCVFYQGQNGWTVIR